MNEPGAWGVLQAAAMIRSRHISAAEYAAALLAQIDRLEPLVQAWARIDRARLLSEAARCDDEGAGHGTRSALHGVPLGIKDNLATAGLETCAGSALLAGNVPAQDAAAVHRLRNAGALVLGKTAMTVFAAMDPAPTRNPWNGQHTPGGSSSGSAAAVAARMCPGALGSQTAGSVLRPAAYCGVVGLKPTYGTVSREGLVACAWSMDHVGPIARHVDDVETLFRALASTGPASARDEAPLVIGVPDRFFVETLDADVGAAFEETLGALSRAGARIVKVTLPAGFEALVEAGIITMYAEMGAYHRDRFAARAHEFPPRLSVLIEVGLSIGAADYLRAQRIRRRETQVLSRILQDITALATPTTPEPAPSGLDNTGDWRFNLPFSHSGHPAITLPCGLSRSGLPIGVQLAAAHSCEDRLFRVGRLLQSHTDWHEKSPPSASPGAH
jgi:aspartyl-tRNA(Asn)/glutamyl-tRNA(Gln) amidotransferase subunit A